MTKTKMKEEQKASKLDMLEKKFHPMTGLTKKCSMTATNLPILHEKTSCFSHIDRNNQIILAEVIYS